MEIRTFVTHDNDNITHVQLEEPAFRDYLSIQPFPSYQPATSTLKPSRFEKDHKELKFGLCSPYCTEIDGDMSQ